MTTPITILSVPSNRSGRGRKERFFPRYHRGWNGGTGSFAPTVYAPISMAIQGGVAWLAGDGQRAVGLSLAAALLAAAGLLRVATGKAEAVLLVATPYVLAVAATRATTTEAWALCGAAVVLALGMPAEPITVRRGLGLAAGVVLVAGSQVGMVVQLGWLLAVAWFTWIWVSRRDPPAGFSGSFRAGLKTLAWGSAGLMAAGVLWLPLFLDGRNLALGELVEEPFDWRNNFLPGASELNLFFTVIAVCLALGVAVVFLRGEGSDRLPPATAAAMGLFFTVDLSTPLWSVPGMNSLQFPWRFLGPATILVVIGIGSLSGRWRWLTAALLLLPSVFVPLRLDIGGGQVPVVATPMELARSVHEHWGLAPVLPSARGLYAPGFQRLTSLEEMGTQEATIVAEGRNVMGGTWSVTTAATAPVVLPIQWWPEWSISIDGREVPFTNHDGLVAVVGPAGTSVMYATLLPSRSRTVGSVLSLAGFILVAGLSWFEVRRTRMARVVRGSG